MRNWRWMAAAVVGMSGLIVPLILRAEEGGAALFEAGPGGRVIIFNGKDFSGWDADPTYWRVENGEIVGQAKEKNHPYSYLTTERVVADFRLVLQVKLVPNSENSGIQFRSERLSKTEMRGPQADVGKGWWGHLYEEHQRGLLTKKSGEEFVKEGEWNTYEILAVGSRVRTAINGHLCTDLDDEKINKKGIIGLQLHAGGPMEVRFRELKLELNPKFELATVGK